MLSRALPVAAQSEDVSAEYDSVIRAAIEFYSDGRYDQARPLFEKAHRLRPSARTLRGLGLTALELGDVLRAADELEAARIDPRNPLTAAQLEELEIALASAYARLGLIHVSLQPPSAALTVDGQPHRAGAIRLEVGHHVLQVSAPGHTTRTHTLDVEPGSTHHLKLVLVREPERPVARPAAPPAETPTQPRHAVEASSPGATRMLAIAIGGLGLAAAIAGTVFTVHSLERGGKADRLCPRTECANADGIEASRAALRSGDIATASTIVSVASLASAALLWYASSESDDDSERRARVSTGLLRVQLEGRF